MNKQFQKPVVMADGSIAFPGFSEWQVRVVKAGFFDLDGDALLALREEHRAKEHAGFGDIATCLDCGFVTAAIYQVQTGRSLEEDFLGAGRTPTP